MSLKLYIDDGKKWLSYEEALKEGYELFVWDGKKEVPIEEVETMYKIDEESGELVSYAEWIRRHG